ncbi:YraN family protein [Membranicola marinus]|uniref:UPF0102 protein KUV50_18835 n=1 Tax=Membranihabitans marinus TaxID=1227546 RepID=A0A953HR41_9BACT|nr:YraN family protein [Membranihabitans marinus]MBY5960217.1 YraN family protein [Membranihabitans marinus]
MPPTRQTGDYGERIACRFLESKGYLIQERNWRHSTLEIDIICRKGDLLIFVEVKYRKDNKYGDPVEFVSSEKMTNISIAAAHYLETIEYSGGIRFDVLGIRPGSSGHFKIRHLKDVHFAGWDP